MRKIMVITIGLIISSMMLFAFAGCGGTAEKESPADQAAAALDESLSALKSADLNAIKDLGINEDVFGEADDVLGSEEELEQVLKLMFGHFDYTIGDAEQVDDSNVNVNVTVSNADMSKAVDAWIADLMDYAMSNPNIATDRTALQAKTIEMLQEAVDKTAEAEDGIISSDVVFPMVLKDGKWDISETIDKSVFDAVLGGFLTAIEELTGSSITE